MMYATSGISGKGRVYETLLCHNASPRIGAGVKKKLYAYVKSFRSCIVVERRNRLSLLEINLKVT